jgi:hypothetical protein
MGFQSLPLFQFCFKGQRFNRFLKIITVNNSHVKNSMRELEEEYLRLFWKREKYQWENYADSKKHNLNRIDSGIYNFLKEYKDIFLNKRDRWEKVFHSIFIRDFVDKSPSIARLRNYIDKQLISSKSVMKKDRARLAKIIRPHIISLINLAKNLLYCHKTGKGVVLKSSLG